MRQEAQPSWGFYKDCHSLQTMRILASEIAQSQVVLNQGSIPPSEVESMQLLTGLKSYSLAKNLRWNCCEHTRTAHKHYVNLALFSNSFGCTVPEGNAICRCAYQAFGQAEHEYW